MICPTCKVELVLSKAIRPKFDNPKVRYFIGTSPVMKPEEVVLIDCLKCPSCGYSDDGK